MSLPTTTPVSAPPCLAPEDQAKWFQAEVHPHGPQLKAYLRGKFPGVRDVDDVVQESYLRIWKTRAIRPIESAKAFLFTIARHLAIDHARHLRASPVDEGRDPASLSVVDEGPSVAETLSHREKRALVAAAIVALSPRIREVIILHKIDGLSQAEVARRLNLSPKTVENFVARGTKQAREHLRRHGVEYFVS